MSALRQFRCFTGFFLKQPLETLLPSAAIWAAMLTG